jgi:hypothetical protein
VQTFAENVLVRPPSFSVTWHDQAFHFERIHAKPSGTETSVWAVSRRGEFIGMMGCALEVVTTMDFEVCGIRWLQDLLGTADLE